MNKDTLLENLGSILETLIEKKVNEKFEEICGKELKETSFLNSTLDRDELCERWGCCKNTLGNFEKNGCLHSIPVHG